ncbi:MAG: CDP-diacylglycerol--serine O-phosphatidyltransferase [Thermoanaerobaculia bacterium]
MSKPRVPFRKIVPSLVTGAGLIFGFLAMLAATQADFAGAVYLLVAAIFCDLFDGQLARRLKATSRFGQQFDSLSDAVSFGVAPAFLVYQALLRPLGPWGIAAALVYVMAGVLRLARFNVTADAHTKERRTLGVPIPIGAGYAMVVALMRDHLTGWTAAGTLVLMALLMVSRVRLPQVQKSSAVNLMIVIGIGNYLAVVAWPSWTTVVWWNIWNVVILATAALEERRQRGDEDDSPEPRTT